LIDRIRQRDAFIRLRRDGVRVRIDPLWCTFVPDSEVVPPQVAFAIGRATGSAVQRNRLRRRLRAILRDSDVPAGLLLIGASTRVNEHTFAELEQCVRSLIAKMVARSTTTPAR
jgi:ribonuclease P protein component